MVFFERIQKDAGGVAAAAWAAAVAVAVVLLLGLAIWAAPARAGRYHVYSCRMPDGEAAPADGWRGSTAPGSAPDTYEIESCREGGALVAALGEEAGHVADVDEARWAFETPSWDRLVGATLWRAAYLHGGEPDERARYEFAIAGPNEKSVFDGCAFAPRCESEGTLDAPIAEQNLVAMPANAGTILDFEVNCGPGGTGAECGHGFADSRGYAAAVFLFAADLVLEQAVGPQVDDVAGELVSAASVAGTSVVSFAASDPGSGVYEAVFTVDGQVVQRTVLDENGGRCRNVGHTSDGLPAFLYVQPCPFSLSSDVGFDSLLVSNGPHHLVVSLIDAAGNSATVLDRQITVDNPVALGPPNGTNASAGASLSASWVATRRQRLTSVYGRRHEIVGRLLAPGGVPISNALVEVEETPASGASTSASSHALTNAQGRFSLTLPTDVSSRSLRFIYRSHMGEAVANATATLQLAVRAGVTLSIRPRTVSVGHSIYFTGRLLGGPVPRDGKQMVLEARAPGGRWIEFDDVRTSPRGVYHASYRFKFPGPAQYQFRALSEPESDYPYTQGASNVVGIFELR